MRAIRRPRDYDAELKALEQKAKTLKTRKQSQLGELVMATGADALTIEELAGALIATTKADAATREGWRKTGAAFFLGNNDSAPRRGAGAKSGSATADSGRTTPTTVAPGAS